MFLLGGKKPNKPPKPAKSIKSSTAGSSTLVEQNPFNQMDEDGDLAHFMPEGIDMSSILNDPSLNQELLDLGWGQSSQADIPLAPKPTSKRSTNPSTANSRPAPSTPSTAAGSGRTAQQMSQQPQTAAVDLDLLDIHNIGNIDETALVIDDNDMNDPELLDMYNDLQMNSHSLEEEAAVEGVGSGSSGSGSSGNGAAALSEVHVDFDPAAPSFASPSSMTKLANRSSSPSLLVIDDSSEMTNDMTMTHKVDIIPETSHLDLLTSMDSSNSATASQGNLSSLTVDDVRQRALKYKREGNNAEAIRWYRYLKQMEQVRSPPPIPPRPTSLSKGLSKQTSYSTSSEISAGPSNASPDPRRVSSVARSATSTSTTSTIAAAASEVDLFTPLETALREASKVSLSQAKSLRESQPKLAVEKMREYKAFQQELDVLASRRSHPGARPAPFQWQIDRKETKIERLDIGETEMKIRIQSIQNIDGILASHNARELSVSLNLNMSSREEGQVAPIVTSKVKYANGSADFNHEVTLPVLRRSKLAQQSMARKKATFDIVLHKGMLWSTPFLLCTGTIPLGDLVNKSECVGPFPVYKPEVDSDGKPKKGVAIGGALQATIQIRSPLAGPELVVHEERRLVVEAWPPIQENVVPPTPSPPPAIPTAVTTTAASQQDSASQHSLKSGNESTSTAPSGGIVLTDREKTDPESVEFLESNEVLENEIQAVKEQLLKGGLDEDVAFGANLRLNMLQTKLDMLVYKVQNDQLSLEDYLQLLHDRLARDKQLALYFKGQGSPEGTSQALRIMHRIKIMQEEIKGAEEAKE
eukprot:scaffold4011_cov197-Ochromonas_danica.AAC.1